MKKKNIAFILFAVAGMNLVTLPILLFIYNIYYNRVGITSNLKNIVLGTITVTTLTVGFVMILAGIIVYIKFRKA